MFNTWLKRKKNLNIDESQNKEQQKRTIYAEKLQKVQEDGLYLKNILKDEQTKELVLAAVRNNGISIAYANEEFKADKEIALIAIKQDPSAWRNISESIRFDVDIVNNTITDENLKTIIGSIYKYNDLLPYLKPEYKNNRELIHAFVSSKTLNIKYASESIRRDTTYMEMLIITRDPDILMFAADNIKDNPEIVKKAVILNSATYPLISQRLKKDKDFILELVKIEPNIFLNIEPEFKKDENILLTAISKSANIYHEIEKNGPFDNIQFAIKAIFKNKDVLNNVNLNKKIHPQIKWLRRNIENINNEHKEYICSIYLKYPNAFIKPDVAIESLLFGTPQDYLTIAHYVEMKHDPSKRVMGATEPMNFIN